MEWNKPQLKKEFFSMTHFNRLIVIILMAQGLASLSFSSSTYPDESFDRGEIQFKRMLNTELSWSERCFGSYPARMFVNGMSKNQEMHYHTWGMISTMSAAAWGIQFGLTERKGLLFPTIWGACHAIRYFMIKKSMDYQVGRYLPGKVPHYPAGKIVAAQALQTLGVAGQGLGIAADEGGANVWGLIFAGIGFLVKDHFHEKWRRAALKAYQAQVEAGDLPLA